MAKAWKCDICGVFYDSDNEERTKYLECGYIDCDDVKTLSRIKVFHMCPGCSLTIKKVLDDLRKERNMDENEEEVKDGN